jgi:cysteine synthase
MPRYDFIPPVLVHSQVDEWVKTTDDESWLHTRKLMQLEGLLVGGSSGAILAGALRWLKQEDNFKKYGNVEGKNVVVLFPDGSVSAALTGRFSLPAKQDTDAFLMILVFLHSFPCDI